MPKNTKSPLRITQAHVCESVSFDPVEAITSFAKARLLSAKTFREVSEETGIGLHVLHNVSSQLDKDYSYKTLLAIHKFNQQWLPEKKKGVPSSTSQKTKITYTHLV